MTDLRSEINGAAIHRLETRLERRWSAYCRARERAERSRNIQDGIRAGRAWARWLAEFLRLPE